MSDCWQCSAAMPPGSYTCPECDTLQPPAPGRSHFEALGIPARYAVDKGALERQFKALSRQLHPDRFAMEGPLVRRMSMEHATALNDAYRTLRDDSLRARYLLELWGRSISEHSGRTAPLPFDFLEEVMEQRERIVEARHGGGDVEAELAAVRARLAGLTAEAEALFGQHDAAGEAERPQLEARIEQVVHRQKYLQSILSEYDGARPR